MKYAAEQISKWHPDKYADAISDGILQSVLARDANAQCGIETLVKDETVVVGGEISTSIDEKTLKGLVEVVIYNIASELDYDVSKIINLIGKQSPQINKAVLSQEDFGAGDQGIVTGYANVLEFPYFSRAYSRELLNPYIAKLLADSIMDKFTYRVDNQDTGYSYIHESGLPRIFKGDAKCQVIYDSTSKTITEIVMSACHEEWTSVEEARDALKEIIDDVLGDYNSRFMGLFSENLKLTLNPAGTWTIGGPTGDAGITGRKLVADAYGPQVPIGGGAHHGKNYTKVDRSGALVARIIALDMFRHVREVFPSFIGEDIKDIKVEISYVIGVSQPSSINVETGNKLVDHTLLEIIQREYNLTPRGMIELLKDYNGYNTIKDITKAYMLKYFK